MPDLVYYTTYLRPAHVLEYSNLVTLVPYARNNMSQIRAEKYLCFIDRTNSYFQSLMSIALLTANANQLRYAFELDSDYRIFLVILLSLSILLQVIASILLFITRYSYKSQQYQKAHRYNLAIGIMVMMVIFVNIIALSFGAPDIAENIIHPQKNKTIS